MITFITVFLGLWIWICFLDYIFKSCMFFPYIHTLGRMGITIKPFTIKCYITRFNRTFQKLSHYKPHFVRKWFILGAIVTCLALLPALGILLKTAMNVVFVKDSGQMDKQILQPVVPGINLPLSHLVYYCLALLLCSVIHEMGHALAAAREGVHIHGCGVFIFGIIPGAYVDLPSEQLLVLSKLQQLSIFCAGIWHNIVLAIICLAILFVNPFILSPLFKLNSGITVIDVAEKSGLGGSSGLIAGDQVYDINDCPIKSVVSWNMCIASLGGNPQPGYCASKHFISMESSDVVGTNACVNASEKLPFRCTFLETEKRVCLPVRKLLSSAQFCNTSIDCSNPSDVCVTPVLPDAFKVFQVKRKDASSVLYIGSHIEFFQHVTVSSWISRFSFISAWIVFTYEILLKYIVSFSAAVALLNVIPCPRLDGQWLCCILVEVLFSSFLPEKSHQRLISQGLMTSGCFLITVTIIAGIYQLIYN